ncbi:MAG: hypothetical protein IPJ79_18475 [Bacteroidetes bacterium]|nr:hypothetical protein [Bacteroidota bacterium]
MKQFRITFLIVFVFSFSSHRLFSQGKTGIFIGGGAMFYNGDLDDRTNTIFANGSFFHPYGTAGASFWLTGRIEGVLSYAHGTISAADSISTQKVNYSRNLSFKSTIDELKLHFEFNVNHRFERRLVNPFFSLGVAFFHFNPKAQMGDTWYELQPLGTEGQNLTGSNVKPYKLNQMAIPIGTGISFSVSRNVRLKVGLCHRFLFTDYLDDVAGNYPDLESLSSTTNGDVAVALSNRRIDGKYPAPGQQRGSSKYKDSYTTIDFSIIFNPGIIKCPASFKSTRPTRRNRG